VEEERVSGDEGQDKEHTVCQQLVFKMHMTRDLISRGRT
jgi:hypothetical protein